MKKVIIAVLMSTMLVGSLAACGSEQSSNQETTAAQGTTAAQQQTTAVQATAEPENVGAVGMWQASDNGTKANYSLIINGDSTFTMTMEMDEQSGIASGTYTIDSAGTITMTAQSATTTNKKTGETKEETLGEKDKATGTYNSASDTITLTNNGIDLKFTRVS